MPIIASAIKKLRKDRKRTISNALKEKQVVELIKKAKKTKRAEAIHAAVRGIDKSVKTHLFHKNKASRLKSKLAKLIAKPSSTSQKKATEIKAEKRSTKKATSS